MGMWTRHFVSSAHSKLSSVPAGYGRSARTLSPQLLEQNIRFIESTDYYFGRSSHVAMQKQNILNSKAKGSFGFGINSERQFHHRIPYILPSTGRNPSNPKLSFKRPDIRPITKWVWQGFLKDNDTSLPGKIKGMAGENSGELSAEDDDLCPVDCVREFKTDEEFYSILEKAKETGSLVVVDFYRTSCGSCKYIEQGFSKICKTSGDEQASVVFLKHNVFDEYDERSETADRLRIRTVPLFHFYKDGILLEAFPTRDKERITAAITKYASSTSQDT